MEGIFYKNLKDYLQYSKLDGGVPLDSLLGPLLFLIYIKDLTENIVSVSKCFADDTSIFSTVFDINKSSKCKQGSQYCEKIAF